MVTVLVCGGRDYGRTWAFNWLKANATKAISSALKMPQDVVMPKTDIKAVIHGGASGADQGGFYWGLSLPEASVKCFEADWETYGRSAGPIRNQRMIDEGKPDVVIAFPGGRGTEDMIRRAEDNGIPVIRVRDGE